MLPFSSTRSIFLFFSSQMFNVHYFGIFNSPYVNINILLLTFSLFASLADRRWSWTSNLKTNFRQKLISLEKMGFSFKKRNQNQDLIHLKSWDQIFGAVNSVFDDDSYMADLLCDQTHSLIAVNNNISFFSIAHCFLFMRSQHV